MTNTNIRLQQITQALEAECVNLKVSSKQETLVATNADSLVHAKKELTSVPYGIYSGAQMVGFILFDNEIYEDGYYWILRFMIDERFQGKGYGKASIKEVINMLRQKDNCQQIRVSHVPHNTVVNKLYKDAGFEETGEFEDNGDIILGYHMQ
ncbi:GNAT family N-acetyltransferase [Paenibacillaceae bacterium]|nr:GNAT family N-acetyltransferase [Paenibacillaceae bacterium]